MTTNAMTTDAENAAREHDRQAPPLGGFNLTALSLEVRRVLRNRRTLMFIVVFPSVFFLLFSAPNKGQRMGGVNALAYVMISMAVYGAMVGATSGGAAVAVERSLGWMRQLRLTPLNPFAYVAMKILTAVVLGLLAVLVVYTMGAIKGVQMPAQVWILSGLAAWLCSLVFAAFGLFMGFLLPSENVMQVAGPVLALLAMFGGLFIPIQALPTTLQTVAKFSPVWGVGALARAPLVGGDALTAALSVAVWTLIFGFGAMMLFKRDTARV